MAVNILLIFIYLILIELKRNTDFTKDHRTITANQHGFWGIIIIIIVFVLNLNGFIAWLGG